MRTGTPSRLTSLSFQPLTPHLCIARCGFVCIPEDEDTPAEEVQAQRQQPSQQDPQAQVEGAAPQVQLAPHVLLNQVVPGLPIRVHPLGLHSGSTVGASGPRLDLVSARSAGKLPQLSLHRGSRTVSCRAPDLVRQGLAVRAHQFWAAQHWQLGLSEGVLAQRRACKRLHGLGLHQTDIQALHLDRLDCEVLALRLYPSSMQNAQVGLLKQIMQWPSCLGSRFLAWCTRAGCQPTSLGCLSLLKAVQCNLRMWLSGLVVLFKQ